MYRNAELRIKNYELRIMNYDCVTKKNSQNIEKCVENSLEKVYPNW